MIQSTIRCDLCNIPLRENELAANKSIISIGGSKPKSKSHITLKFDGQIKDGDLCYACAKKFRDYIESQKESFGGSK